MSAPEAYEFEDVTVDLRRMIVRRGGVPVALEPKAFDVLRFLIEHRDRLVTKDELLDAIWKDTFVTPNVLTRAVAQLRKGLGDDAFEARYIETAAKRGYRFIAPVKVAGGTWSLDAAPPQHVVTSPTLAAPVSRKSVSLPPRLLWLAGGAAALAVGIAAYFALSRLPPAAAPSSSPTLSLRRLEAGNSPYGLPGISPDGRSVAYTSDESGEIFALGLAPGSKELMITGDQGRNVEVQWSPDGRWLAYHSIKHDGIWIVPSTGGVPRQLANFGGQPAWSPGGDVIVFASNTRHRLQSTLWSVRADGSNLTQMTKPGNPRGGHSQPSWSHDGQLIAFSVSPTASGFELWTKPAAGGDSSKLVALQAADLLGFDVRSGVQPQFAPDDKAIYWIGRTPEGSDNLSRLRVDAAGAPVGQAEVVLPLIGSFVEGMSIARDGTVILALTRIASNIWAANTEGSAPKVDAYSLTHDDARDTKPSYSRDGRLAFSRQVIGQPTTVWLMSSDGDSPELLTVGLPESIWFPQWQADTGRIFVLRADRQRAASIDTTTRAIGEVPVDLGGAFFPALAPDGRTLAFHVADAGGVTNVWTAPLEGGPRRQVTFDTESIGYPEWSPDGKSLAVEITRGGQTQIGVVSADGGPVEPLTFEGGQNWTGGWSPDAEQIAFAGERDGVWNVFSVSRRTKRVTQWTHFTSMLGFVRYPIWSPRNDRIVFERNERRNNLWTTRVGR